MRLFKATGGILAACILISAAPAQASVTYRVVDLGTLNGQAGGASSGFGINASGVATGTSDLGVSEYRAFRYSAGTMTDLGTLGGWMSQGLAINDGGSVAGYGYTANATGWSAFVYSGGSMKNLGSLGGFGTVAFGINNADQVVGWSALPSGEHRAFLYDNGVLKDIAEAPGSNLKAMTAYDINNVGAVTGDAIDQFGNVQAFILKDGALSSIGTLGSSESFGRALNDKGQVTGASALAGSLWSNAFLYSGGQMVDIGPISADSSSGNGINNLGEVVGQAGFSNGQGFGFVFSNGVAKKLTDLLEPVSGAGWSILDATGINDAGQIVGTAQYVSSGGFPYSQRHAVLLLPVPEPSTYALMFSGLALMYFFRRKVCTPDCLKG